MQQQLFLQRITYEWEPYRQQIKIKINISQPGDSQVDAGESPPHACTFINAKG